MNLAKIALKNLKRNFSFYALYLFSVSFVLMIFYMSYSNKFFMRRRMREPGIYTLLGYQKTAMLRLLTFETVFICIGGLIAGILLGSLLHKGLTLGIVTLLKLSVENGGIPLINPDAVSFGVVFVMIVLLALALSNAKFLRKATLLDMVRMEQKRDKPVHIHAMSALTGVFTLTGGYMLAMDMARGKESLWYSIGFSPMALLTLTLVVTGTALFIFSFLPFACKKIKRNRKLLYGENTIIVVPKFMHRIRSNAKSIILIILMSAGTLSVLGATVLSVWYPLEALERIIPCAIEYRITDEAQKAACAAALDRTIGAQQYQIHETTILKVTATAEDLPAEYHIGADKGRTPGFECISETDYHSLLKLQGKESAFPQLNSNECILIKYRPDTEKSDIGSVYTLSVGNIPIETVTVKDATLQNPIGFGNSVGTLVVSDQVCQSLLSAQPDSFHVVSIDGGGLRSNKTAFEAVAEVMPDNAYLVSAWYRQDELVRENSSTLLLVCFATVIFFVATGSILYFQNISSVTYDKPDFEIMGKMGYNHAMFKRVIRRQIQIYFLIPYIMGVLHSIFALICYKSALMDDLLGKNSAVFVPILFSVAVFTVIYLIYYQVTKRACYKIVLTQKGFMCIRLKHWENQVTMNGNRGELMGKSYFSRQLLLALSQLATILYLCAMTVRAYNIEAEV